MRVAIAATVLAMLACAPTTAPAQQERGESVDEAVLAGFEAIASSIVRIRTRADLEYPVGDEAGRTTATRPYEVDGTGVVVGQMMVEGMLEYLVLTNHHVANASNYVLVDGGYLRTNRSNTLAFPSVPEESYLILSESDSVTSEDIRLAGLVWSVRGDMTLMRTVNAHRDLPVFEGRIGYEDGEIRAGDAVITSGYPRGSGKVVMAGEVLETDHLHELGIPHEDLLVDIRVAPGQSGSPLFLIEEREGPEGPQIDYRLIGLVHARDARTNFVVPFRLWLEALEDFPDVLSERLVR